MLSMQTTPSNTFLDFILASAEKKSLALGQNW